MPDVPDLAALREKADRLAAIDVCEWSFGDNETELMVDMTPQFRDECVEAMLAVLSLVDDLRAENARWHAACDAEGVPHDPDGLIRHHRGNAALEADANAYAERLRLQAENERLREALTIVLTNYRLFVRPQTDQVAGAVFRLAERALAGSLTENKEP